MKNKLYYLVVLLLLNSCKFNGSFQGLFSYYKVTKKTNPELFVTDGMYCDLKNIGVPKVYITNGLQLKKCIHDTEDAVVYLWSPNCNSHECIPLEIIAAKCQKEQIKLSIVAEYYDADKMNKIYNIEVPIFAIDTKYYKSNLTSIYLKKLIAEITSKTNIQNKRFLLFKKGQFVNSYDSFEDLEFHYLKNKMK